MIAMHSFDPWQIYTAEGLMGVFEMGLLISALIQGVVLFGVASNVTRYCAFTFFTEDGTSYIFKNYGETEVLVDKAIARTAAMASMQAQALPIPHPPPP
jgi:hypothetical protein